MDPFVVVSLGKKTYKTKHIRHNLNPVYDEKMLFQVLRHEQNYSLSFAVVDRDKFSSNDFVSETVYPVQEIIKNTQPMADPVTGLYTFSESGVQDNGPPSPMSISENKSRFRLPLSRTTSSASLSAPANRPDLAHRSSTKSLRTISSNQEGGAVDGETLMVPPSPSRAIPAENIEYDLKPVSIPLPLKNKDLWQDKHKPELHFKVKYVPYPALRQHFWRAMLRQYDSDDSGMISRLELATMLDTLGSTLHESTINSFFERFRDTNDGNSLEDTELTIDQAVICLEDQLTTLSQGGSRSSSDDSRSMMSMSVYPDDASVYSRTQSSLSLAVQQQPVLGTPGEEGSAMGEADVDGKSEEHVIQIRECPLCHQPRMNKRSEMDIVTHLATCASQDWRQVDKLVMGGFVTSSQAQRKWYSKVTAAIRICLWILSLTGMIGHLQGFLWRIQAGCELGKYFGSGQNHGSDPRGANECLRPLGHSAAIQGTRRKQYGEEAKYGLAPFFRF
jgi:phosphatidylserine decarboxylase